MIKDLEIENFRCFEYTKIEGFERVNLIGGKNNSGKTALLEAILLNQSPQPKTIFLLRELRQETSIFLSDYTANKMWSNLFWDNLINSTEHRGNITVINYDNKKQKIEFHSIFEYTGHSISKNLSSNCLEKSLEKDLYDNSFHYNDTLDIKVKLSEKIHLDKYIDNYNFSITSNIEKIKFSVPDLGRNKAQFNDREYTENDGELSYLLDHFNVQFLPYHPKINPERIVRQYSQAELNNQGDSLLKILKKIDPEIEDIRIYNIGSAMLYLKKETQKFLPITMFGDAIKRVTEIILRIINNPSGISNIILIDEIENGIHYSNHREFWKALFELSKELDVQIFATTHSLEMIQAFRDIGLNYYADSGAYFELNRHYKTKKIIGIKRDLDILDYAIEHGKGVRGE